MANEQSIRHQPQKNCDYGRNEVLGHMQEFKIHCRKRARKDHAPVRAKRFRKPLGCRTREEIQKRKYQIEEAGLVWAVVERVPIHEEIKCWLACIKKPIRDIRESAG